MAACGQRLAGVGSGLQRPCDSSFPFRFAGNTRAAVRAICAAVESTCCRRAGRDDYLRGDVAEATARARARALGGAPHCKQQPAG